MTGLRQQGTVAARPALGGALLVVAIILVATNLRPAVTSLGSILDDVRAGLGASTAWASVLTALPPVCFAIAGFAVPMLTRRVGLSRAVGGAAMVIAIGLLARIFDGESLVLLGTFVACAGISVCNVLIPVVIKECYPARIGLITGLYTAGLQSAAAAASALTPQLQQILGGWRPALGSWTALAALAGVLWFVAAPRGGVRGRPVPAAPLPTGSTVPDGAEGSTASEGAAASEGAPSEGPIGEKPRSLLRNGLAWQVTGYFAMQSLFAYVVMGWLPEVLVDSGVSRGFAGVLSGLISLLGVPVSLIVTPIASRRRSQVPWVTGLALLSIGGVLGLMLAPAAAPLLWALMAGLGMGCFSIAVAFISLRTRTPEETQVLSTMAQSIGYLIAAVGPLMFGLLHGLLGGWTVPWLMVLGVLLAQFVIGLFVGRPRYV